MKHLRLAYCVMVHEHVKFNLQINCLLLFTFARSETGAKRLRLKKFLNLVMKDAVSVDSHRFASLPVRNS